MLIKQTDVGLFGFNVIVEHLADAFYDSFNRHSQPHKVWMSLCSEDGCLSAASGDHHFPARDLSLSSQTQNRAPCGQL